MHSSLSFGSGTLYAFLLVLSRIAGAFVLVPLPGMSTGTEIPRVVASLAITVALLPFWPRIEQFPAGIAVVIATVALEAAYGMAIGLAVACVGETLKMGAQLMSTQAGFGYASVLDPNTSADAGLLVVAAQLIGSLLFLALGLDREVLRIFADSLLSRPPGSFYLPPHLAEALWHFASGIFSVGARLALPAIALLGLIDISLGLLGRINSQLQLITVSFPLKMMTALLLIAALCAMYPRIFGSQANLMLQLSRKAAGLERGAR